MMAMMGMVRFIRAISKVFTKSNVNPTLSPASEIEAVSKPETAHELTVIKHEASETTAKRQIKMSMLANLQAYVRITPVYSAIHYIQRLATLIRAVGALLSFNRAESTSTEAVAISADGVNGNAMKFFKTITDAPCISAPHEATNVTGSVITEDVAPMIAGSSLSADIQSMLKTTHSAKIVTWQFPMLEDGTLYIPQAYNATQTDNTLEVD